MAILVSATYLYWNRRSQWTPDYTNNPDNQPFELENQAVVPIPSVPVQFIVTRTPVPIPYR